MQPGYGMLPTMTGCMVTASVGQMTAAVFGHAPGTGLGDGVWGLGFSVHAVGASVPSLDPSQGPVAGSNRKRCRSWGRRGAVQGLHNSPARAEDRAGAGLRCWC